MRAPITVSACLLLLNACGDPGAPTPAPTTSPAKPATSATPATPASASAARASASSTASPREGRAVSAKTDAYEFAYGYPAAAATIPALRQMLEADLAGSRRALERAAARDAAQAGKRGYPFRAHVTQVAWAVVTDLPAWLSLSAKVYTYGGGAHGMTSFRTLLWDKAAGRRMDPVDLFASKSALREAVRAPFCASLRAERAKRRGGEAMGDIAEFSRCTDPIEATIILGSADRARFTRIGFLIEPYAAGPYAEGAYEITLPVTPAVLGAVRPAYRAAFSAP